METDKQCRKGGQKVNFKSRAALLQKLMTDRTWCELLLVETALWGPQTGRSTSERAFPRPCFSTARHRVGKTEAELETSSGVMGTKCRAEMYPSSVAMCLLLLAITSHSTDRPTDLVHDTVVKNNRYLYTSTSSSLSLYLSSSSLNRARCTYTPGKLPLRCS